MFLIENTRYNYFNKISYDRTDLIPLGTQSGYECLWYLIIYREGVIGEVVIRIEEVLQGEVTLVSTVFTQKAYNVASQWNVISLVGRGIS